MKAITIDKKAILYRYINGGFRKDMPILEKIEINQINETDKNYRHTIDGFNYYCRKDNPYYTRPSYCFIIDVKHEDEAYEDFKNSIKLYLEHTIEESENMIKEVSDINKKKKAYIESLFLQQKSLF